MTKQELEDFKLSLREADPSITEEEMDVHVGMYLSMLGMQMLDNPENYGLI